jgi:excisionase family DNA binding protein
MPATEELLDIKKAALFLHVSETSLRRWTSAGRLPCLRVGLKRERRFRRSDLVAFMEEQPAVLTSERIPRPRGTPANTVGGIEVPVGTHLCALYSSEEGRARQAVAFLADGLRPGHVCFLVGRPPARQQVLDRLVLAIPMLQQSIDKGELVLAEFAATLEEQLAYWEQSFVGALARGAQNLRVVGDLCDSALAEGTPRSTLMDYERNYDRLIAQRFPVVTLCQYPVSDCSGADVLELFRCHANTFAYPIDRLID